MTLRLFQVPSLALGVCLMLTAVVDRAAGQTFPEQTPAPTEMPTEAPVESLDPSVAPEQQSAQPMESMGTLEPLEVNQQQSDQFFRVTPRQTIVERTGSSVSDEDEIEPPPGSQTPAELTPTRQLSIPIR